MSWLGSRQCDSGGLNGRPEKQADVCYSWWVLASLAILDRLEVVDAQALCGFVLSCQDERGGIGDRPGSVGDVYHTFFGFAGLCLLGALGEEREGVDPVFALPEALLRDMGVSWREQ